MKERKALIEISSLRALHLWQTHTNSTEEVCTEEQRDIRDEGWDTGTAQTHTSSQSHHHIIYHTEIILRRVESGIILFYTDMKPRPNIIKPSKVHHARHPSEITSNSSGLTVLPQLWNKLVCGLIEQRGHVIIQRIHVLHQPLACFIIHLKTHKHTVTTTQTHNTRLLMSGTHKHLSSVMNDAEICVVLQFLGFEELRMSSLFLHHLLHETLICGFREPTFFIQKSQDTRRTRLRRHERLL